MARRKNVQQRHGCAQQTSGQNLSLQPSLRNMGHQVGCEWVLGLGAGIKEYEMGLGVEKQG